MDSKYQLAITLLSLFVSCKNNNSTESSPTMGRVKIACDQQIRSIMEQEEDIFERNYKYANVDLVYGNESAIFKLLGTDSIKSIISARALTGQETNYFIKNQINPRQFPFAVGALALLCSSSQEDSVILFEDFSNLCKGIIPPKNGFKAVVIEDVSSGIAMYLLNKFQLTEFGKNVYTLSDKTEILDYLAKNKEALAVVDWGAFSDSDDQNQKSRLKNIKVLGISQPADSGQTAYLYPNQYELQDAKYPLTRTFYFINCSGKSDLGLGFASFVTGDIGQKILLKAGLLPLYQTERWIEIKSGNYKVIE